MSGHSKEKEKKSSFCTCLLGTRENEEEEDEKEAANKPAVSEGTRSRDPKWGLAVAARDLLERVDAVHTRSHMQLNIASALFYQPDPPVCACNAVGME